MEPQRPAIQTSPILTEELRHLMSEVEELRQETKSIMCRCTDPDCPFQATPRSDEDPTDEESTEEDLSHEDSDEEDRSPDLGFGSMEKIYKGSGNIRFSLPHVDLIKLSSPPSISLSTTSNPLSLSLTNIPRRVQKRADGTIVENDYPGFYSSNRKSKKKKRLTGICSMTNLNHLDVCSAEVPPLVDCQVDQDGTITTDYTFSRQAPERKNVRSSRTKKLSLVHTSSNPTIYRRKSAGPVSFYTKDLTRHASVPAIEKNLVDRIRAKSTLIPARHSIAV